MKKFVPMSKRTKKEQKAYNAQQRGSWGTVNPCSRTFKDRHAYDRNREKAALRNAISE